eukprot:scaffold21438_cov60-Cyclotella_meneghiniana.AAC.8
MASPPAALDAGSRRRPYHRSIQTSKPHILSYLCSHQPPYQQCLHPNSTISTSDNTATTTTNNQHHIGHNNHANNKNYNNNNSTANQQVFLSARCQALHPLLQSCLLLLTLLGATIQALPHNRLHSSYHPPPSIISQ